MTAVAPGGPPIGHGPIEEYLDTLFDRLAGTNALGRRMLADAEEHLLAAAAEGRAAGLSAEEAERRAVQRFGTAGPLARQVPLAAMTMGTTARRTAALGWLLGAAALLWYGAAGVLTWLLGWLWLRALERGGLPDTFRTCDVADLSRPTDCRGFMHGQMFPPVWTHGAGDFVTAAIAGAALLAVFVLSRRNGWLAGPRWTPARGAVAFGIAVPALLGGAYLVLLGVSGLRTEPVQTWSLAFLCSGGLALLLCMAAVVWWLRGTRRDA